MGTIYKRATAQNNQIPIYAPGGNKYIKWITNSYNAGYSNASVIILEGGSDVNPKLYEHRRCIKTKVNDDLDLRDLKLLDEAIGDNKAIIGICRSSQLLCVVAGGKLIQHSFNHHGNHSMTSFEGYTFNNIISTHHQIQYPQGGDLVEGIDYHILSTHRTKNDEGQYVNGTYINKGEETEDIEICFYPKINALAIQTHPEDLEYHSPELLYINFLTKHLINGTLSEYIIEVNSNSLSLINSFEEESRNYYYKRDLRLKQYIDGTKVIHKSTKISNLLFNNIPLLKKILLKTESLETIEYIDKLPALGSLKDHFLIIDIYGCQYELSTDINIKGSESLKELDKFKELSLSKDPYDSKINGSSTNFYESLEKIPFWKGVNNFTEEQ